MCIKKPSLLFLQYSLKNLPLVLLVQVPHKTKSVMYTDCLHVVVPCLQYDFIVGLSEYHTVSVTITYFKE